MEFKLETIDGGDTHIGVSDTPLPLPGKDRSEWAKCVYLTAMDSQGGCSGNAMTPAQARELADELRKLADWAEGKG